MQVLWMVLVTLVLVAAGALALATRLAAKVGSGAVAGIGCAMSLEKDPRTPPPLPPGVEDQVQVTRTGR